MPELVTEETEPQPAMLATEPPDPPSSLMADPPEVTCSCPLVFGAGGKLLRAAATAAAADMDAFDADGEEGDTMEAASCQIVNVD